MGSRYYDAGIRRFISADTRISDIGGDIRGYNMFSYCFNNPINMLDSTGSWPKWIETAAKVVSAVAVVAAVAVTVTAVTAFTAGTGSTAAVTGATIFLGAALSGINGGIANESKGNSYLNGCLGGTVGGLIQGISAKITKSHYNKESIGVILGGSMGIAVGTAIVDLLNNMDPDSANSTSEKMVINAVVSGLKGLFTSSVTAYVGSAVNMAIDCGTGGLLSKFSYGFAEGIKAFYGWADDAMVYGWE